MNLKTKQLFQAHKKRSKIAAMILAILMLLSFTVINVSAATLNSSPVGERYNSWNLCTSQVDTSYFYTGGSSLNYSWDTATQNAWILCKRLAGDFNTSVVETATERNAIKMLDILHSNGFGYQAAAYGTRWNSLRNEINNLIVDCSVTCSTDIKAQSQNFYQQLQTTFDKFNTLLTEITDTYSTYLNYKLGKTALTDPLGQTAVTIFNYIWSGLADILSTIGVNSNSSSNFFGLSLSYTGITNIVNVILPIVKTFAYALVVVLFGINITQTSLQNEILTLRGGIKIFARVILAKVWIDLAVPICMYSLKIINSLASQILNVFTNNNWRLSAYQSPAVTQSSSLLSALNTLINIITGFISTLPTVCMLIAIIICVAAVYVKIISRVFELTALISLSPIFFATLVGDETRRYFKKFMSAFLTTAGYILFMAIVYAVASKWIQQCTSPSYNSIGEYFQYLFGMLPRTIIIIACCRVMRKPPKALTGLFEGA